MIRLSKYHKISKFTNSSCCKCELCSGNLVESGVYEDSSLGISHIYRIGTLFKCPCGKSQTWTNAIRNEKNFLQAIESSNLKSYYQGFCNDRFCPVCGSTFDVLSNSHLLGGKYYNVIGCYNGYKTDKHNTHILIDFSKEDEATNWNNMINYYMANIDTIKSMTKQATFHKATYYHGTTDKFSLTEIAPPNSGHGNVQELGRKKNLDRVFVTKDIGSAKIYAGRAVQRFGGNPAIYEVEPAGVEVIHERAGTSVYMANKAKIIKRVL